MSRLGLLSVCDEMCTGVIWMVFQSTSSWDITSFDMHIPAGWLTLCLKYTPDIVWVYVSLGMQDGAVGHLTLLHRRIFL